MMTGFGRFPTLSETSLEHTPAGHTLRNTEPCGQHNGVQVQLLWLKGAAHSAEFDCFSALAQHLGCMQPFLGRLAEDLRTAMQIQRGGARESTTARAM